MKKLLTLIILFIVVLASVYLVFPYFKDKIPILPNKTEKIQEEDNKGVKEVKTTPTPVEESFKPINVTSIRGFEVWYNGYESGIVNSYPSYVITDTSDFLVYHLDYNDKSIILTWEQKRGTLHWINLKVFRYEKLVFNKTSTESKGRIEYVHNDPRHHHSPSVSYSFDKREPGTLLYFNITNKMNRTLSVIIEKALYNGTSSFEMASEDFIFGNMLEIKPFGSKNFVLSYPNTTPPHGVVSIYFKFPERAGKIGYEVLKIPVE